MTEQPNTPQFQDTEDQVVESASATTSNAKNPAGPTVYIVFVAVAVILWFGALQLADAIAFHIQYLGSNLTKEDIAYFNEEMNKERLSSDDSNHSYLDRKTIENFLDDSDISTTSYQLS
ncbi:hypothetical protein [Atopobium fossor]|uniref:hypothetical protein n=1 Tax=Atopobium fossor TaxID=39487 RepID=UPI0003FEC758|nr:hypothetical protein [Atopobium fossor]